MGLLDLPARQIRIIVPRVRELNPCPLQADQIHDVRQISGGRKENTNMKLKKLGRLKLLDENPVWATALI